MKYCFTLLVSFLFFKSNAQWEQIAMPTTKDIISSSFVSDDEGWIGTSNTGIPTIYHTADGGATWNSLTITGASGGSSYLCFADSLTGYAVVNAKAFKTT